MFNGKEEIPGFFRDPKTGKYYREKPDEPGNSSLKKLKADKDIECKDKITAPKITGVTSYFRKRELGMIGGINSETEYLKLKTQKKVLIQDVSLNRVQHINGDLLMVDFITGCDKSMFGKWGIMDEDRPFYIVGEQNYVNVQNHRTADFRKCNNIVDMCRGPAGTIICLYNNPFVEAGSFQFLEKSKLVPSMYFSNGDIFNGFPFYSCCALKIGYTYAIGGDNSVLLFDTFDLDGFIDVRGKVYTLSYHEPSNALVHGVHHGTLYMSDVRTRKQQAFVKVSTIALTDSIFVDPSQVIVADAENTLVMVDFRNMKVVTMFNEHKHSVKKMHFSFANNMLCGTGSDNVIRIWSAFGGNPIHQMKPLINAENNIRGWLNGDGDKTYLNYFEAEYHKVFEI